MGKELFTEFLKSLDGIYCINLPKRVGKKNLMVQQFQNLDIEDHVTFVDGVSDPENPERGCWQAHQKVMQIALENNQNNILIFEDDAILVYVPGKIAIYTLDLLVQKRMRNWEIIYLGCCPAIAIQDNQTVFQECSSIKWVHATQTHAYITNQTFMSRFVHCDYESYQCGIDTFYSRGYHNIGIFPSVFMQRIGQSDVSPYDQNLRILGETYNAFKNMYVTFTDMSLLRLVCCIIVIFTLVLFILTIFFD